MLTSTSTQWCALVLACAASGLAADKDLHEAQGSFWLDEGQMAVAQHAYERDGAIIVRGMLNPDFVKSLRSYFQERHGSTFNEQYEGVNRVGTKRKMITVPIQGPFKDPTLLANPAIMSFFGNIFQKFKLFSLGAVTSLPGADMKDWHRDSPALFNAGYDGILPPFAVTVVVPLIEQNATTGSTCVQVGSHKDNRKSVYDKKPVCPHLKEGDATFMDWRMWHNGGANKFTEERTILYLIYGRPWWQDEANYKKMPPLIVPDGEFESMDPELAGLLGTTPWLPRRRVEQTVVSQLEPSKPLVFETGDRVIAKWKKNSDAMYLATVMGVNQDGTLHLYYDDGETARKLKPSMVIVKLEKTNSHSEL